MAQSDWVPGYELIVAIGGVQYPFKTVSYKPSAKMINRANSKYMPGFTVKRSGQRDLVLTAAGPYKLGEIFITVGGEYVFLFKAALSHVGFEFIGIVQDADFSDDVEDGPNLAITVVNQADFSIVVG